MCKTIKDLVTLGLGGLLVLQAGCAGGTKTLAREDLDDPIAAQSYRVTTTDGRQLTFISLHMDGEWLEGTVRVTDTVTVGEGETERTNVTNRYEETRIPWSEVERVEAEGVRKRSSGFLFAGGAVVLGAVVFVLLSETSDDTPTAGGTGKGF